MADINIVATFTPGIHCLAFRGVQPDSIQQKNGEKSQDLHFVRPLTCLEAKNHFSGISSDIYPILCIMGGGNSFHA